MVNSWNCKWVEWVIEKGKTLGKWGFMSAINAFNWLYCHFLPGFTLKKIKLMRTFLKRSSLIRLTSLWVSTLVVSGEKNLLLQFCLQHAIGETPGALLPATPPKPAWDLIESIRGTQILQKLSGLSTLGWIAALLLRCSNYFSAVLHCEFPSHWFLLQWFSCGVF